MDAATATLTDNNKQLNCAGDWTMAGVSALDQDLRDLLTQHKLVAINGQAIEKMDSAGALILSALLNKYKDKLTFKDFNQEHLNLMRLVSDEFAQLKKLKAPDTDSNVLMSVGKKTYEKWGEILAFLNFVGQMANAFWRSLLQPKRIQWRTLFSVIDEAGGRALPIIALMSFLIGMVLAYQMGIQLQTYGANIYIVDFTGLAILREFAPLITAIILAGRSATSFTAQIGTMHVNEEIDALETMGDPPMERLVLPKIFALLIVMPLLTVWADVFGMLGSVMVSHTMLGIGFQAFIQRFQHYVALRQYVLGVVKAPVFALIIAAVGSFQGFRVASSADSVGRKTTKAAVQSIFLIIIADAAFSIVFSWLNL